MHLVQRESHLVEELIPPEQTMKQITVDVPSFNRVHRRTLEEKLGQLKRRGLMDGGLVLVQHGMLQGYLAEAELEFGLTELGKVHHETALVPLTICAKAPMEYALEMFGKLGLRYLCVLEEGSGKLVGVIVKKQLVAWLDGLKG
jgi:chloride channel 3/4/5